MTFSSKIWDRRGNLPCSLRLLTPALSSFSEEREKAVATFKVHVHDVFTF
jgi:hypothetical protein